MAPYSAINVRACRQAQPEATIVNLTPLYTAADYDLSPDDYHPDNLGHFAIAEAICTAMERQKLLG
ncbi:MAG TPA: hypothetical protein VHI51_09405 [Ktedonobacterales bacterium]|jgi:hypothetical protein|nr:hypothetical protein [Ktedonobacterales bacterium]